MTAGAPEMAALKSKAACSAGKVRIYARLQAATLVNCVKVISFKATVKFHSEKRDRKDV